SGPVLIQTTNGGGPQLTIPPAGAESLTVTLDSQSGQPRQIASTMSDQPQSVIIQLRGTALARVAPLNRGSAQRQLALSRQRAGDAILRIASQAQGRALGRHEVLTREYTHVFHGFAARLSHAAQDQVRGLPGVQAIYPDVEVHTTAVEPDVSLIRAPE